jgi:energy-coupling factor transporter ATP-binding protein EcfA2/ribosomal protein L31
MHKIDSITLTNFKFFHGKEDTYPQNKIILNQKNLLLYGENGSGKSSLYWALYTFLQSVLKENGEIFKYFQHNGSYSLKNRYAAETDPSAIKIDFKNSAGSVTKEISVNTATTKNDTLVTRILKSSDFINYKYLSKVYDFRNSEDINLFPLFESELLTFIDFDDEFTLHDGNLSGSSMASDWWKFISKEYINLPKNAKGDINFKSEECVKFSGKTLPDFNTKLKSFLASISEPVNKRLAEKFNESFKVLFDLDNIKLDFNIDLLSKAVDNTLPGPKIKLTVELTDPNIPEEQRKVEHPHTYLNEAKLTAIALAIRFAMLDKRPVFSSNSANLLILDDFLISLDMCNRNTVLNIILDEFKERQIVFLTHDKNFFQFVQYKIKEKRLTDTWLNKEVYAAVDNENRAYPEIIDSDISLIESAHKYFKINLYTECAFFIRKAFEKEVGDRLPEELKLKTNGEFLTLQTMWQNVVDRFNKIGKPIDQQVIDNFARSKLLILNPEVHYQKLALPLYRSELKNALDTLDVFSKLPNPECTLLLPEGMQLIFKHPDQDYSFECELLSDFYIDSTKETNPVIYPKCKVTLFQFNNQPFFIPGQNKQLTESEVEKLKKRKDKLNKIIENITKDQTLAVTEATILKNTYLKNGICTLKDVYL